MEIFIIESIEPPENRPAHWTMPNHQTRNVLNLSAKIGDYSWSDYLTKNGYKPTGHLNGTERRILNVFPNSLL